MHARIRDLKSALSRLSAPPRGKYRDLRFKKNVRHLFGPTDLGLSENDVVLLCVLRDCEPYMEEFLDHHFSLGVRHAVLMDNGSVDRTVEIARKHDGVTMLRMDLLFGKYSIRARHYLISRFTGQGWALVVDGDELFDFPYSRDIGVTGLVRYLNQNGYSAMNANMLDMFPEGPLLRDRDDGGSFRQRHAWYDISHVEKLPYEFSEVEAQVETDSPDLRKFYGGIMRQVFGGNAWLFKHPLLAPRKGARLISSHHVADARVADVSGVLLHYKFVPGFMTTFSRIAREGSHRGRTDDYRMFIDRFTTDPDLSFRNATAQRLDQVDDLLDHDFMVASKRYREWTAREPIKR